MEVPPFDSIFGAPFETRCGTAFKCLQQNVGMTLVLVLSALWQGFSPKNCNVTLFSFTFFLAKSFHCCARPHPFQVQSSINSLNPPLWKSYSKKNNWHLRHHFLGERIGFHFSFFFFFLFFFPIFIPYFHDIKYAERSKLALGGVWAVAVAGRAPSSEISATSTDRRGSSAFRRCKTAHGCHSLSVLPSGTVWTSEKRTLQ